MRSVREIPVCTNVPILVRAALNEPIEQVTVANAYRLRRALSTLAFLRDLGARIIVMSHRGQAGTETLLPSAAKLQSLLPRVFFFPESIGTRVRAAVRDLSAGDILVLENLRRHRGERTNDPVFAQELSTLGDAFVEDSFDTCHRMHASIVGLPALLPSYAGLLLEEEVAVLSKARTPTSPSLAVVGGAKFTTKQPVLQTLLATYDRVFVGGALANDFFRAKGYEVGKSLLSLEVTPSLTTLLTHPSLLLPTDVLVVPTSVENATLGPVRACSTTDVRPDERIVDHGPKTRAHLATLATQARTILWNGPLGQYENGFTEATDALARAIATSYAYSIVGGGDTIASIEKQNLLSQFSFVSTGGGAMLDFLATGTLPGIEALG